VGAANLYVQQSAPWALAKQGDDVALDTVLASLAACLARLAVLIGPFMPGKAQELWEALGRSGSVVEAGWVTAGRPALDGATVRKPDNLFPRPAPA
jgi:methionyl-tRNA synthetase